MTALTASSLNSGRTSVVSEARALAFSLNDPSGSPVREVRGTSVGVGLCVVGTGVGRTRAGTRAVRHSSRSNMAMKRNHRHSRRQRQPAQPRYRRPHRPPAESHATCARPDPRGRAVTSSRPACVANSVPGPVRGRCPRRSQRGSPSAVTRSPRTREVWEIERAGASSAGAVRCREAAGGGADDAGA